MGDSLTPQTEPTVWNHNVRCDGGTITATSYEDFEYDGDTKTYLAHFDPQTTSVLPAIVDVIATIEEISPLKVEPLYHVIDTDALDRLVCRNGRSPDDVSVSFAVHDLEVRVSSSGVIRVFESPE